MSDQPQITRLSLEDALAQGIIKPLPNNPNAGTSRGEYMVAASGEQFGAMRSIVLDRDGNIAAGNHTATVFAQEGIASNLLIIETDGKTLVAVKRNDMALDDPDAVDTLQYAIADNRASEVGLAWNFDVMQAVGKEGLGDWFTEREWEAMEAAAGVVDETPPIDVEPQIDKAEALQKLWQIERGQVWVIPSQTVKGGVHRVMCGDSTSAADVERLMGGKKAELLFTSPPYADMRDYKGDIELSEISLSEFIAVYAPHCEYQIINLGIKRSDHAIVPYWDTYIAKAQSAGLKLLSWNVWDRGGSGSLASETAFFAIHHEWLFVFGQTPKRLNRTIPKSDATRAAEKHYRKNAEGKRIVSARKKDGTMKITTGGELTNYAKLGTVISASFALDKSELLNSHPARFSVDLVVIHLDAITDSGDICVDPFVGSGTTLVACEQTGRVGYGMEIEPAYVAVILQRLTDMGLTPKLDDSSCVY